MEKIEFSIITVNLNNFEGLKNTIESVVYQSFKNFEYIIIDGGSKDKSQEIIKNYQSRITYWVSEPDSGIYSAMNKGIKNASGKYCLFLNSGDRLFDKNTLSTVFNLDLQDDIIYGQQFIYENGQLELSTFLEPEYITLRSFMNSTLPHQCTFIKQSLFEKIGLYNEENRIVSDWEFNLLALFKYNSSIRKIDIPIAVFDRSGVSSNSELYEIHRNEKIKSFQNQFPRIFADYQYYDYIETKYYKIPRIIRKIFNQVK